MSEDSRINYIELPAADIERAKQFYGDAFGWTFEDYGPDYCAFSDGAMDGGFYRSPLCSSSDDGAALVVLYATDLEALERKIQDSGGKIAKPIFSFPGGRRFHFRDTVGNELAVWSEK